MDGWFWYLIFIAVLLVVVTAIARVNARHVLNRSAELQQKTQRVLEEMHTTNKEILSVLKEIRDKK
jgi:hypothetical protein